MSERIIYNRRKMEILSRQFTRLAHPEWTKEQCREEAMKEENIQELVRRRMMADLTDKLCDSEWGKYFGDDGCRGFAKEIMDKAPKELHQNINEYIDGKELTDIKFNGISVKDIMTQFEPEYSIGFVSAARCICYWKDTDYKDPHFAESFF